MPRYAVKIGEIHLVSDKPISMEEREQVKRRVLRDAAGMVSKDAVKVYVDGEEAN